MSEDGAEEVAPEDESTGEAHSTSEEVRTAVDHAEQGNAPSARSLERLPPDDEISRQAAEDELQFKRTYAYGLFGFMGLQLFFANLGFFLYAWLGVDWNVDPSVMHVWLGATVVEVFGITAVVTRYLFPNR